MSAAKSLMRQALSRLGDPWTLFPAAVLAAAAGGLSAGRGHAAWAVAGLLASAAALAWALRAQAAAERLAARLCGEEVTARPPLTQSLTRLAATLERVEHRTANRNPLTNLPTREHLCEAVAADIAAARGPQLMGAIRFKDFDRLAAFDQAAANAALRRFALRLVEATKPHHVIAQVDRDCFALWFRGDGDLESAGAEFRAIVYVAGQDIEDRDAVLTPALEAAAVSYPADAADAGQLLVRATAALARPGRSMNGEIALAAPPSSEASRERFMLEQDLVHAIAKNQLTMVFQPVIDLAPRRITGAEALLRWRHPTLGPVSPARFIPIVEAIGLSERYGLWVLNTACREAKRWRDEGLTGLKVAVNLSAHQLLDPDLRTKIERTLQRHGLSPKALELELTETAAMADAGRTFDLFGELRAMGVSLSIDDFGSGYSSLSYLKNLPFDKLKIDREFVTDIDKRRGSRAICKALIELGRGLDLVVLAEGVETAAEVETLRNLGCQVFQGYYYAKPLSPDDFRDFCRDPAWPAAPGAGSDSRPIQLEGSVST